LLSAGANGGSEAASILSQAIRNHLAKIYGNASWPIMVHIYLSLDKLAITLARAGVLKHPQELRQFAQSFSVNQPLFSIIDVGQGKERADYRIKGGKATLWFAHFANCEKKCFVHSATTQLVATSCLVVAMTKAIF
jgi:hypothetical protein